MKKMVAFFTLVMISGTPVLVNAQTSLGKFKRLNIDEKFIALNFIENISFTSTVNLPSNFSNNSKILKEEKSKKVLIESRVETIENMSARQVKYAMLMDVAVESIKNQSLFDFLEEWYGTCYRLGGTTKKGIDCSAFTKSLMSGVYELKIPRIAKEQYKNCAHIKKDELMESDLVFFNTRGGVSHVGVYITNGYFVHSSSSEGVMISNLKDAYYSKRFISGGRVIKIIKFPIPDFQFSIAY